MIQIKKMPKSLKPEERNLLWQVSPWGDEDEEEQEPDNKWEAQSQKQTSKKTETSK